MVQVVVAQEVVAMAMVALEARVRAEAVRVGVEQVMGQVEEVVKAAVARALEKAVAVAAEVADMDMAMVEVETMVLVMAVATGVEAKVMVARGASRTV